MNRREFSKRLGMVVGGTALAIIGVPLLVLPGSGMAFILVGVGLVGGGESALTCAESSRRSRASE